MDKFFYLFGCISGLFIFGGIIAWLIGWDSEFPDIGELLENRKHNAEITRQWIKNGRPILESTVGWRPDPINKADGYRDEGFNKDIAGDGHTYSRLIRGGTAKYKARFERDVKDSSN